jgi:predicted PurR-regulated permease PerM
MRNFWKRYRAVLVLLLLLVALVIAFHHVMLPFLVAVLLAFLIEPVVSRLAGRRLFGRETPRGVAVLVVYALVFSVAVGFFTLVAPQLAREVGQLAEAVPEYVQTLRDEKLPALNERIDRFVSRADEPDLRPDQVEGVKSAVGLAHDRAILEMIYAAGLPPEERELFEAGAYSSTFEDFTSEGGDDVLVRVREEPGGSYAVLLEADELSFVKNESGGYRLQTRPEPQKSEYAGSIDLVRAMDEALSGAIETSGAAVADTLAFGQRLLFGIFDAFVTVLVTLMVAAFLSIDVPGIRRFIKSLFPEDDQNAINDLLSALNVGLAGVIRGQLIIAALNGVLTWIGLVIFGIKYAFVLAVFAAALSLIPIFGSIISTIPAVLIALTQSVFAAIGILVWIIVIHFIEGNILNPKIIGSSAEMHPAIIIFALIAGEHSYGIVGAVLAVPIASVVQTMYLFFKNNRWQHSAPVEESRSEELASSEP